MIINQLKFRFVFRLIVTALALTGCSSPSTPLPTVTVNLNVSPGTTLSTNQSVSIIADVSPSQDPDFLKWTVNGTSDGTVIPNTGGQVVYTAGMKPGVDIVVAEGTAANGAYVQRTVTFTVKEGAAPPAIVPIKKEKWPQNAQDAANFFAKGEGEWTQNQYGGWTLIAVWPPIEVIIPSGVTFEGYNDGANPPDTFKCYTVLGPDQVTIQGGTFWYPDDPSDPTWTAQKVHRERKDKNCIARGFTPN